MTGYVRNDTTNNIADGNIINASDLDGEFDAIVAAFVNTTGHTHDGTAAEGAPITKIGPTQDVVASAVNLTPKTTNTVDLGSSSLKFKDIYNSGTAYLTTLDLTNALTVADGGTGATTLTGVVKGNGTSAFTAGSVSLTSEVTGTLPVANGGTNLTTFPALSLPVANTLDTLSALTATASQSIRVNSGGTAWEAYTPSTGDVVGPASAVSGNIATFDGTTGKLIQDSALAVTNTATLNTAQTFTALKTFSGSTSVAATKLTNAKEVTTISATAATGTIDYDVTTQSVLYYTSNASANWTVNFRGSSGTSLDTLMSTGESMTVAFLVTQGATAYYNSAVQVDGSSVTPKWQGGTAPAAGNDSGVDAYTYTIVKTGSATFTVFAAQTQFK